MTERSVVVVPYDPAWPTQFEHERARLAKVLPADASIEHVGSTAVTGLAAKPIIDIMVGVASLASVEERIGAVEGLGYHYVPEYEVELPERRYFRRPRSRPRSHHLHCVVLGGDFWQRHIAFRELLRSDEDIRSAYGTLKLDLVKRYPDDRRAYTEAKSPFIESALSAVSGR